MAPATKVTGLRKNPAPAHEESQRATAFVNWSLPLADGSFLKASKGFPIFQNAKYPNKYEDVLVNLAREHGGNVEVMLKCRISLNNSADIKDIDLSTIQISAPPVPAV
jgi:hypothetical protein